MVKRALIFIVVLYAISITMNSCRCDMPTVYYRWKNFDFWLFANNDRLSYIDVNNPIEKTELSILVFVTETTNEERPQTRTFNIISEAHAFSCEPPTMRLHSIVDIVITARSVNSDVVEEVDITSLFRGLIVGRTNSYEVSIEELINHFNANAFSSWGILMSSLSLFLRDNNPEITGRQTFEITITFDDGIVLTQKTEELTLI